MIGIKLFSKRYLIGSISAGALLLMFGCNDKKDTEVNVGYVHASYAFDVNDLNQFVGSADNVFVGYVEKIEGTEYKFPTTIETETGSKTISTPHTNYSIRVIDNLKGELKKDQPIPLQKAGGISEDGSTQVIFENDILPEEGKYYIFSTLNQPDGSILAGGTNTTIPLNVNIKRNIVSSEDPLNAKSDIVNSKEYKDFEKAIKNQVKFEHPEYFENNYSDPS
ncbi:cell surface protein [Lysinibacillus parviboronicapiens]|uniref:cell surface protein n=1 Tax=Lysinibacillus parviboronicapiens TaxID=436516 RepID=UPI003391A224